MHRTLIRILFTIITSLLVGTSIPASLPAADSFLDDDGYFWSATNDNEKNPVILDRADLIFYTDGLWRWTLTVDGQTLMKVASDPFYSPTTNPRHNDLVEALHKARQETDALENRIAQQIVARVQPSDESAREQLNVLLARLKRGEKSVELTEKLQQLIDTKTAANLMAEREKGRKAIFDSIEALNQSIRFDLALQRSPKVASIIISERAMLVPANGSAKPLTTDASTESYSEAFGMPYAFVRLDSGVNYAVLLNKPQPGSLAERLELFQGDAVTAINDQPLRSPEDLERLNSFQNVVTVVKQVDGQPRRAMVGARRYR